MSESGESRLRDSVDWGARPTREIVLREADEPWTPLRSGKRYNGRHEQDHERCRKCERKRQRGFGRPAQ